MASFPSAQQLSHSSPVCMHHFCLKINSSGEITHSSSLPGFEGPIFTSEFGNWLVQATGASITCDHAFVGPPENHQEVQLPVRDRDDSLPPDSERPCKRSHSSTELDERVDMVPLRIGNEEEVEAYYDFAFRAFNQINCRQIAKAYIKVIEPCKKVKYPYNGRRGQSNEERDPEKTKPDWWPMGVVHREPDHLKKPDRIRLLVHIFRKLGKTHNITVDMLEEAGSAVQSQIKPRDRLSILDEIYKVRRAEECFESGKKGANMATDANSVVYVVDWGTKPEETPQTRGTHPSMPNAYEPVGEIKKQNAKRQNLLPSPYIISDVGEVAAEQPGSILVDPSPKLYGAGEQWNPELQLRSAVEYFPPAVAEDQNHQWLNETTERGFQGCIVVPPKSYSLSRDPKYMPPAYPVDQHCDQGVYTTPMPTVTAGCFQPENMPQVYV
ncbi:conserved hypothetical protein [Microsporum canis CBS 113480]|uniref:Subtelomeric hrmA-associated cluster protein AFUB-079030/YDR124W-like helical bundle domain-containing protein n=1 Tax=Arthroderma otae (strain ATCC MYA-4605 / CBS 113480) TaxID=554155 RepID=C5FJ99_ARTOC|nr:conserved hypothetical protein [Microsporum canis CBS 113480]EEQ29520.1 conserved hypothetical protein [Microsporum canis CBS 113480]